MRYCLHPKSPHKNVDASIPSAHHQDDVLTTPAQLAEKDTQPLDQQVTCHFCKYLLADTILGDCRVKRWVGSGTFGDVYEAEQLPPLSRRVAVKVMAMEHFTDGKGAEIFQQEVRSIAALDHPNIMPVLRVGNISDGRPYLVMKFAARGSLQKYCKLPSMPLALSQHVPATPPTVDKRVPHSPQINITSLGTVLSFDEIHELNAQLKRMANEQSSAAPDEQMAQSDSDALEATHDAPEAQEPVLPIEAQETHNHHETMPEITAVDPEQQGTATVQLEEPQNPPTEPECYTLTPQQLLPYLEGAAASLQYAHDHDIIHLDVKPANLLLDAQDRILLADFGVSTLLEGYTHASLRGYVGTPLYTAPEQWLEQPRAASDQYALAITCYQLLAGRPPFLGNLYTIMHGHIQLPPPPIREFQPLIPPAVEAVILRALAKDPTARFNDVQSFANAYREALAASAGSATDAQYLPENQTTRMTHRTTLDLSEMETRQQALSGRKGTGNAAVIAAEKHEQDALAPRTLKKTSSVVEQPAQVQPEPVVHAGKLRPRKRTWRTAALLIIVLLLAGSSMFSAIYLFNPCMLGICPALALDTHDLHFTNSGTQTMQISDPGTADLSWKITPQGNASWLSISTTQGIVHQHHTVTITLISKVNQPIGSYSTVLLVTGQNVPQQSINVTMDVTGANQVVVSGTITDFTFQQGTLQPASQTLTITNQSSQTVTWNTSFSENNWLVVTPDQGVLKAGQAAKLTVTAQAQNLSPNTYLATMTLIGKLDNGTRSILNVFDIRLNVATAPITPTPTPPALQFPTYHAQAATATNAPSMLRSGHNMVWDDQDNLLLVFGGIDDTGTLLNDLWSYNTVTGAWTQLNAPTVVAAGNCSTVPSPRMNAAMVWDSLNQQLLLYGGVSANNRYLGDLWSYNPTSNTWTALNCSTNPPGERASNGVWNGHQLLLLGGMSKGGLLSDFWSYMPANGWQKLYSTTPLGQRAFQAMTWDSHDNRLYVFGGLDASGQQQNDFWSYTTTNNGWLLITPTTTSNPQERQQAMATWDSAHNVLLLMGGWKDGQDVPFYGLWAYDPTQNAWKLLTPLDSSNNPYIHGRTAAVMIWDSAHKRAYIYAGAGSDKTHSSLNDLWTAF